MFVPAHAPATESVEELARYNIAKVRQIAERIVELCREPMCFEVLLQKLLTAYDLKMDHQQYVLVGSTVRSYLSWLKDTGRLTVLFEDGMLLWQRA